MSSFKKWYYNNKPKQLLKIKLQKLLLTLEYINNKKKLKCVDCGICDYRIIQYHHLDESTKEFDISSEYLRVSKKRLENEINKCVPLCANCHFIRHSTVEQNLLNKIQKTKDELLKIDRNIFIKKKKVCKICNTDQDLVKRRKMCNTCYRNKQKNIMYNRKHKPT